MIHGIGRNGSTQFFVGIQYGYIVIPSDVDRDRFIEQCYRWERVSILIEKGGGVVHECYITKSTLQEVEFPLTHKVLGSCVSFLTDPFTGHPVIFGLLSKEDESQLLKEGEFRISKNIGGGSVVVSGNSKKGVLNLSVNEGEISEVNIIVTNSKKDAKINLRSRGSINLEVDDQLKINSGNEPMVKGGELKVQLDETNGYLSDLVQAISTSLGILDILTGGTSKTTFDATMLTKSPGDYSDIDSKKAFLE